MKIEECYKAIKEADYETVKKFVLQANHEASYSFLAFEYRDINRTQNLLFWATYYLGFIENDISFTNVSEEELSLTPDQRIERHPRWLIVVAILRSREVSLRPEGLFNIYSRGFNLFQEAAFKACWKYNDQSLVAAKVYYKLTKVLLLRGKQLQTEVNGLNQQLLQKYKERNDVKLAIEKQHLDSQLRLPKKTILVDSIEALLTPVKGKLKDQANSLLHIAAYFGCTDILDLLLSVRPDLRFQNSAKLNPVQLSVLSLCHTDHIDVPSLRTQEAVPQNFRAERIRGLRMLLDYLYNSTNMNPLIREKFTGIWLTDYDKPNQKTLKGVASRAGSLLTSRSTVTALRYEGKGDSLLHMAIKVLHDKPDQVWECIQLLRIYGTSLDEKNADNLTPYELSQNYKMKMPKLVECLKPVLNAPKHVPISGDIYQSLPANYAERGQQFQNENAAANTALPPQQRVRRELAALIREADITNSLHAAPPSVSIAAVPLPPAPLSGQADNATNNPGLHLPAFPVYAQSDSAAMKPEIQLPAFPQPAPVNGTNSNKPVELPPPPPSILIRTEIGAPTGLPADALPQHFVYQRQTNSAIKQVGNAREVHKIKMWEKNDQKEG